jgi:hypothetical protein
MIKHSNKSSISFTALLTLIIWIGLSHTFTSAVMAKEKHDKFNDLSCSTLVKLYMRGGISTADVSNNKAKLLPCLKDQNKVSLYCRLKTQIDPRKAKDRLCDSYQPYKIEIGDRKKLDLAIYVDGTLKDDSLQEQVKADLFLTNQQLSPYYLDSKNQVSHQNPKTYLMVTHDVESLELFLNTDANYQLFDHLTAKKYDLEVGTTDLDRMGGFNSGTNSDMPTRKFKLKDCLSRYKYHCGTIGTAISLTLGGLIYWAATQEAPVNPVIKNSAN